MKEPRKCPHCGREMVYVSDPGDSERFATVCFPCYRTWVWDKSATTYIEPPPVPVLLFCPMCHARHIDTGEFEKKPHHTHACQSCGHVWRPALVATVGVQFLPGFKS